MMMTWLDSFTHLTCVGQPSLEDSAIGQLQILEASGMSDLRSIVAVRRAFQLIPAQREQVDASQLTDWEDSENFWEQVDRSESDDEDAGGEVGMTRAKDKARLRLRRSFELLLTSGRVIRFEVCEHTEFSVLMTQTDFGYVRLTRALPHWNGSSAYARLYPIGRSATR